MKNGILKIVIYLLVAVGFIGCKMYLIPIESFKEQVKDIMTVELRTVYTKDPFGIVVSYKTYPIDYIKCMDKNTNPYYLKNGPSIEIRFTERNNKRTVFYFDQIYVKNSTVFGDRSRLINLRKSIPIDSIKLIEIQDGRKNYKYIRKNN